MGIVLLKSNIAKRVVYSGLFFQKFFIITLIIVKLHHMCSVMLQLCTLVYSSLQWINICRGTMVTHPQLSFVVMLMMRPET